MNARCLGPLLTGWVAGWLIAGRRVDVLVPIPAARASITVVVPARNEARRLPNLLSRLAAEPGEPLEVLVVDDASIDCTAEVARQFGASVLRVDPPDGWMGKSYACWEGACRARGEILVFLDADTEPAAGAVAALATLAAQDDGLVSVQPWHRTERAYEWLSACCNLVAVLGSGTGRSSPRRRWWRRPMAFGPALAMRTATYFRVGGHSAVRDSITEDLALARQVDAAGMPVHVRLGGESLRFRMYPDGIGQLVEGWTKNLAVGAAATPPLRLLAVTAWVAGALGAALTLGRAGWRAAGERQPPRRDLALASLVYVMFVVQTRLLLRRVGGFGPASAFYPVPLGAFVALWTRSALLVRVRRRVTWRGRGITLDRSR